MPQSLGTVLGSGYILLQPRYKKPMPTVLLRMQKHGIRMGL